MADDTMSNKIADGFSDIARPGETENQKREDREREVKGETRYKFENAPRYGGRRFGGDEADIAYDKEMARKK